MIALQAAWFGELGLLDGLELELNSIGDSACRPAYRDAARRVPRALPQRALRGVRRRGSTSTRCASSTPRTSAIAAIVAGRAAHHRPPLRRLRRALRGRARVPRRARRRLPRHARAGARPRLLRAHGLGVGHPGRRRAGRDDLRRRALRRAGRADRRQARARRRLRLRHRARRARARGGRRRAARPGGRLVLRVRGRRGAARAARPGRARRARAASRPRPTSPGAASRASCATPSGWARASSPSAAPATASVASSGTERPRSRSAMSWTTSSGACESGERLPGHVVRGAARRARRPRADALGLGRRGAATTAASSSSTCATARGIVQLVIDPERAPEAHATAHALRLECVVRARGQLVPRSEATRNDQLPTGAVELAVECARAALLERGAAVPARRRERRRGAAHPPPLPRPAPPANAGIAGHSHAGRALDPALPRRARLPRPRDARR